MALLLHCVVVCPVGGWAPCTQHMEISGSGDHIKFLAVASSSIITLSVYPSVCLCVCLPVCHGLCQPHSSMPIWRIRFILGWNIWLICNPYGDDVSCTISRSKGHGHMGHLYLNVGFLWIRGVTLTALKSLDLLVQVSSFFCQHIKKI